MNDAYLAGFFDGEGCITITKNGSLQIRVINTSLLVLELYEQILGGKTLPRKQIVNKPQYHWSAYGDEAVEILNRLLPFLVEKKEQAFTALEWMKIRSFYTSRQKVGRGRAAHPERATKIKEYQDILTKQKLGN